jgi:hypothetical protein
MAVQDGSSLGRFTMQRAYLAALVRKVTGAGTLLDPTTAFPVVEAATRSITVDDAIAGTTKLVGLANQLSGIKPGAVQFVQPEMHYTGDDPDPELRAKAAFTQPAADQLFQLIRQDRPLTETPAPAASATGSPTGSPTDSPTASTSPSATDSSTSTGSPTDPSTDSPTASTSPSPADSSAATGSPSPSASAPPAATGPGGVTVRNGDDRSCVQGWTGTLDQ